MASADSVPFRLIAIAIFVSVTVKTLINVIFVANGFGEWSWLPDIVISSSLVYFVHWATLNNVHDARLVLSIPATDVHLKRVAIFSLKLMGLTLLAIVPLFFIVMICSAFLDESVLRGQTLVGRIAYIIGMTLFVGAAVGYWGTWLPATVAGRNADFKAAARRGKTSFARSAPWIGAVLLAQTICFQIAILAFSFLAGLDSGLKVPVFEDNRIMGAFEFVTTLANFTAYAAIAVILCQAFKESERSLNGQPLPAT